MKDSKEKRNNIFPYIAGLALVVSIPLLTNFASTISIPSRFVSAYLLIVIIASVCLDRWPAFMVFVLGAVLLDSCILPPYLVITQGEFKYLYRFASILVVGLVINLLASQTRQQAKEAKEREERMALLYRLSKDLAAADSTDSLMRAIRTNVGQIFDCYVAIFVPKDNKLQALSFDIDFPMSEEQDVLVNWVFKNDQSAGVGADMFKESIAHYLPLKTSKGIMGVLGIAFRGDKIPDLKNDNLLEALASQAAVGLQRVKQEEISRQLVLLHDREKLQTVLLNSISHDLRTPLVSIKGVLSSLLEDSVALTPEIRQELLSAAYEDTEHLNRIVGNLLDITRLEAGALRKHVGFCELRDVIGAALQSLRKEIEGRKIIIHITQDLPEIPVDFVLMMRVFVNLIDNAVKYSPASMPIEIWATLKDKEVQVKIKDRGFGIPDTELSRVFEKFYRTSQARQITGTGLGLSICKGIVEVHDGRIWAENNADKGTTFSVVLPLASKEL